MTQITEDMVTAVQKFEHEGEFTSYKITLNNGEVHYIAAFDDAPTCSINSHDYNMWVKPGLDAGRFTIQPHSD